MRIFDAPATAAALPHARLVPALEAMFARGCEMPARHVHEVKGSASDPGGAGQQAGSDPPAQGDSDPGFFTSLIMPAWLPGRYYGVKTINIAPGNARRGLPGLHASYLLYDGSTGVPLALIDGDVITTRRTAAASALAARWLARADARRLLVVGAGRVARELPFAYRAVRPIGEVRVWARSPASARTLAEAWRSEGIDAHAVTDLAAACAEADIVSCATLSTEPLVRGAWLRPGTHLDLSGSVSPAMRAAADDCFAGAALYVDTEEALKKSGELLGPMERGVFAASGLRGTLAALARAECAGRAGPRERTVFKSVGCALEDLAAAILVYESAGAS